MNFEIGTKFCGFETVRVRESAELHGTLVEMVHEKTGAELCWMNNGEQNKLFCVGFKTLPEDSTGVFHILEHSVLCGSEKYPVKEPFVDLLRSSMNTFLNAMTYPDKTVYPVSSRNSQDFLNLMSVYLDAVFAPVLTKNPNVFYQEGIHTELNDGVPSYKGVVFNEMKGAMSGVNDKIEYEINKLLFPDNCYRFNSGGDPSVIPDLTYEQYVDTYKKYYHPSNARFFLDGNIPLEDTLGMIHSYLEKYEKQSIDFEIAEQKPTAAENTAYYEIDAEESTENKTVLAFGKIIGTWENKTKLTAAKILCDVLADTNESLLKRAVLSSGLAEDFEMMVMDCIAQPYLLMIVRNTKDNNCDKIREIIRKTAEKAVKDGISKELLTACVNRFAFHTKQVSEPQGLYRALSSYNSWLYGGDPMASIVFDDTITELRRMIENGEFESLLSELLIDDSDYAVLHMLPSHTLGAEERKAEEERLAREASARSPEDKEELLRRNKILEDWQQTPDSPEDAASLPTLDIGCVSAAPEDIKTEEKTENGVTVLYHPVPTHGIVYLTMYFSLTMFDLETLAKMPVVASLLGELPTENRTAAQLQQDIKTNIGSLSFETDVYSRDDQTEKCTPRLIVRAGVLTENVEKAKEIILDILLNTQFDDTAKIKEIVLQNDEIARQDSIGSGHYISLTAVRSHYSARDAVADAISGYTSIKALHNFARNFDKDADDFVMLCKQVQADVIGTSGLVVSVTADEEISVSVLLSQLPSGKESEKDRQYESVLPMKMGIRIPAQIAFASKGCNLAQCGMQQNGSLRVASNIVSLNYLWNLVRVQGGAYGAGFPVSRDGTIACYSYRDPSPARSLGIYDGISDFINEFCRSDEDLNKYILSAVATTEPLRTPSEQGAVADEFYFGGVSYESRTEKRRQMLATNREAILGWCKAVEKMAENGAVCVVGHDEALKSCADLTICEF